ncbi:MAG TPA: dihydropyrimidinase [Ardenticatenaceae bacterium]|nr:dihydropyrimidinase [Ardenticatenaceae bacterium]
MRTLIRGGRIVTAGDEYVGDILIDGEQIALIGRDLQEIPADRTVDASGRYVLPGGIDVHTHLDMPFGGTVSADDFFTGHRAAAFGGTTTHVDFAIQGKGDSLRQTLSNWHERASGKAAIDYGFHVAITDLDDRVMEEIGELPGMGVTTIKLFMAYKGALMIDDETLFKSMIKAGESGVMVMVHAENGDVVDVLIKKAISDGNLSPIWHALTRPPAAEAEATARAVRLAEIAGTPLYVVHLTEKNALKAVAEARARGQKAYAETCIQYLFFTKDDLGREGFEGAKWVCSPPFREAEDQEALWQGLRTGDLSAVSTDHCPFNFGGQKELGKDNFAKIPNGVPGIEDRLYALWDIGVKGGQISPSRFVELVATNPAKLMGIYPRKGTIAVGSDADVLIWDGDARHTVSAKTHHMNVDYNLYEGRELQGKAERVFVRGNLVVDGDQWLGEQGSGQFLHRATPTLL